MASVATMETTHTGLDKVTRYRWKSADDAGEFEWIPKGALNINRDDYQRVANDPKVLEFASNWSWIACGVLTVAFRDGKFWVADGQHRKLAADRRSDIKSLPCMIWEVEHVASEASAFLATNTNRKPITSLDRHRAKLTTGDPTAEIVERVLSENGVSISKSTAVNCFKAVTLANRLAADDEARFQRVFKIASDISRNAGLPVKERLLSGLYEVDRVLDDGLLIKRLRDRIYSLGAAKLEDSINRAAAFYARGGPRVFASGIIEAVNKGLHNKYNLEGIGG